MCHALLSMLVKEGSILALQVAFTVYRGVEASRCDSLAHQGCSSSHQSMVTSQGSGRTSSDISDADMQHLCLHHAGRHVPVEVV